MSNLLHGVPWSLLYFIRLRWGRCGGLYGYAEPFSQQEELDTKEQRLKVVTDELNQAAIEAKKNAPKREKTCYFERAKMKRDAARLAKKPRTPKDQTKGRSKKQGIE